VTSRIRSLCLAAFLTLSVVIVPGIARADVCSLDGAPGSRLCFNDWFNGRAGTAVRLWRGGKSNEQFEPVPLDPCNHDFRVTHTCPFHSRSLDGSLYNDTIIELQYTPKDLCVGSGALGTAILTSCADDSSGTGAGKGSIMVEQPTAGGTYLTDRYWANTRSGEDLGDDLVCPDDYAAEPKSTVSLIRSRVFLDLITPGCVWTGL
jgi:hypothetical protein